jgi:hypothetical protein
MTLEATAQVLASALLLVQTVSANPSLPQSMRDQAQVVAEKAITEATRVIAAPKVGPVSCTVKSDKYNYQKKEVVVFDWTSTGATSVEFIQSAASGFPLPNMILTPAGQFREVPLKTGYPFVALKAKNGAGQTATCSTMVYVY